VSWTWSGDPATSDRDAVRFWVQDTDASDPQLTDEQLDFLLARYLTATSTVFVAAAAAGALASRYAGEPDVSADGVSLSFAASFQRYTDLAARLRAQYVADRVALGTGTMDFTGQFDLSQDPFIDPLCFGLGMHDNYLAGRQDFGSWRGWFGGADQDDLGRVP